VNVPQREAVSPRALAYRKSTHKAHRTPAAGPAGIPQAEVRNAWDESDRSPEPQRPAPCRLNLKGTR